MGTELSKAEALQQLQELRQDELELSGQRVPLSIQAKAAGATWQEVGDALGITRQAAHAAYRKWKQAAYTFPLPDGQDPMFE